MIDFEKYIGLPYKHQGRDFDGVDCWGLVYLIYKNEYKIKLPKYTIKDYAESIENASLQIASNIPNKNWSEVKENNVTSGDVILLKICGFPCHIGLVTSKGKMIHSFKGCNVVREFYDTYRWKNRVDKFYHFRG